MLEAFFLFLPVVALSRGRQVYQHIVFHVNSSTAIFPCRCICSIRNEFIRFVYIIKLAKHKSNVDTKFRCLHEKNGRLIGFFRKTVWSTNLREWATIYRGSKNVAGSLLILLLCRLTDLATIFVYTKLLQTSPKKNQLQVLSTLPSDYI